MTLEEALTDVKIAFLQVEFAVKLHSYCEFEKVNLPEFDTDEIILLEHGNLHFPTGNFSSHEEIVRAASVTVALALGASALVLNNAWDVAGIGADPKSKSETVKLRTLVYMVRCAYAHGLADPKWEVRKKYRRVLEVDLPNGLIALDLRTLDGERFDFSALGGYNRWYEIRDVTVATLTANNAAASDRRSSVPA